MIDRLLIDINFITKNSQKCSLDHSSRILSPHWSLPSTTENVYQAILSKFCQLQANSKKNNTLLFLPKTKKTSSLPSRIQYPQTSSKESLLSNQASLWVIQCQALLVNCTKNTNTRTLSAWEAALVKTSSPESQENTYHNRSQTFSKSKM